MSLEAAYNDLTCHSGTKQNQMLGIEFSEVFDTLLALLLLCRAL